MNVQTFVLAAVFWQPHFETFTLLPVCLSLVCLVPCNAGVVLTGEMAVKYYVFSKKWWDRVCYWRLFFIISLWMLSEVGQN